MAKLRSLSLVRKERVPSCSLPSLPTTPSTASSQTPRGQLPSAPSSPSSVTEVGSPLSPGSALSASTSRRVSASHGSLRRLPPVSSANVGAARSAVKGLQRSAASAQLRERLNDDSGSNNISGVLESKTSNSQHDFGKSLSRPLVQVSKVKCKAGNALTKESTKDCDEKKTRNFNALLLSCDMCDIILSILQHLRIHEIGNLRLASSACGNACISSTSQRLRAPVYFFQRRREQKIDLPSIEVLYADDTRVLTFGENEELTQFISSCTSLRRLFCSRNQNLLVTTLVRALAALPLLEVLDLSHNGLAVDSRSNFQREQPLEPLFDTLVSRRHLRVLDLSYNSLRDPHAFKLVEALELRCNSGVVSPLEQLVVRSNYLGNGAGFAFGTLLRSSAGAGLWRLDMRTNQVEADGACAMLGALKVHPAMRELRIGYNKRNDTQDLQTAGLACMLLHQALVVSSKNKLQLLDLNNVRVGDEGLRRMALALSRNDRLKRLDLAFNSIGPAGAAALGDALQENRHLESLDLRDNEIADEGAAALSEGLKENFGLRKLQVARNGISARGALALRAASQASGNLHVDFGASGAGSDLLQGMMRRTPRMAELRLMRDTMRGSFGGEEGGGGGTVQHMSNMFAC
eukprot:TRINITY_DN19983_c0_g3_i1.p1 TRINITY_DN19983_c0_g3~~TRINITY_DN19983_c0_g3_i1.p1  ORF type:complete len:633 (+),score=119.72 TRINITY_DN19983_c0_g3_i1:91-1989(+)